MHLKSIGELKTSTLYRTGFPCGYCPPKHKRGLPSPAFSLPKLSSESLPSAKGHLLCGPLVPVETSLLFLLPSPAFADIQSSSSGLPDPLVLL